MDYDILLTKPENVKTVHAWTNIWSTVEGSNVHQAYVKPVLDFADQEDIKRVVSEQFIGFTDSELTVKCSEHPYRHLDERKHVWISVEYTDDNKVDQLQYKLEERLRKVTDYKLRFITNNHISTQKLMRVGLHCHLDEVFSLQSELDYRSS